MAGRDELISFGSLPNTKTLLLIFDTFPRLGESEMTSTNEFERHIPLEGAFNFRDVGGYRTGDGRSVRWRRIFRSDELQHITHDDSNYLRGDIGLATVIDLRHSVELEQLGTASWSEMGIRYLNLPFSEGGDAARQRLQSLSNLGEMYLQFLEQPFFGSRMLEALETIAQTDNHPLVFHCTAGKDRTAVLAGVLLSILGVAEDDIIKDYTLTSQYMEGRVKRAESDPVLAERRRQSPQWLFNPAPENMAILLSYLRREHGSVRGYVEAQGGNDALFQGLEDSLLD